jgi:hypothetical protein
MPDDRADPDDRPRRIFAARHDLAPQFPDR